MAVMALREQKARSSARSIKELGLEPPKSVSGIFRAQCGSVDLLFDYLKTPSRLDLIEIDFK